MNRSIGLTGWRAVQLVIKRFEATLNASVREWLII
jgi:hypothetical protein